MASIGIPKEVKPGEGRVALLPDAVGVLTRQGHTVWVQKSAGLQAGAEDQAYRAAGARVARDAKSLYRHADVVVKVKEPQAEELPLLRPDHVLFCYLHLAAAPELTQALCDIGLTALGFETVEDGGALPLLAPMSEIAGRLAVESGAFYLGQQNGGRGLLLGGAAGAHPGCVLIVGAGEAGCAAAVTARGLGAQVVVMDIQHRRLAALREHLPGIITEYSSPASLERWLPRTDLLIGAVLVAGARTPRLISRAQVKCLPPGAVLVDIAIDQGGCIAGMRPTDWRQPAFMKDRRVHIAVANLPGAVPRTASVALSGALLPWLQRLLAGGVAGDTALAAGVNVRAGRVVHPALL